MSQMGTPGNSLWASPLPGEDRVLLSALQIRLSSPGMGPRVCSGKSLKADGKLQVTHDTSL